MVLSGSQDPSSQPWVMCFQIFCLIFMYSIWTNYEVCRRIRAASSLVSRGDSEIPSLATQGWHSVGCAEGRLCTMALVSQYLGYKRGCNQPSRSWCHSQGTAQAQSHQAHLPPPSSSSPETVPRAATPRGCVLAPGSVPPVGAHWGPRRAGRTLCVCPRICWTPSP